VLYFLISLTTDMSYHTDQGSVVVSDVLKKYKEQLEVHRYTNIIFLTHYISIYCSWYKLFNYLILPVMNFSANHRLKM